MNHTAIAKLVERVKQQDSQAFTELYEITYQKMYYIALSILKDEFDAQDAVQETYIRILNSIHMLDNNKLFIAWANKTAYSVCIRQLSKRKEIVMEEEQFIQMPDQGEYSNPFLKTVKNEKSRELMHLISELPPELRATILFRYYEDFKISEIASIMDCPEGTVKSRLNTAKRVLREAIRKKGDGNIFLGVFGILPIRQTLLSSAEGVSLSPDVALDTLVHALDNNNMSTNVHFTPQPPASAPRVSLFQMATLSMAGIGGAAVISSVFLVSPKFMSVIAPNDFTNQSVSVSAQVRTIGELAEFYAIDTYGTRIDGVLATSGYYIVELPQNGTYTLYAISTTHQQTTAEVVISCIDKTLPVVLNYTSSEDELLVTLSDDNSGVDFDTVYGVMPNGETLIPVSVDEQSGQVAFLFPDTDFKLYVTDLAGNKSRNAVTIIWK